MSAEAPTYRITTVRDFLSVPEDRRGDMLVDFAGFIAMAPKIQAMMADLPPGALKNDPLATFIWIDDGKHDLHVRVTPVEDKA